MAEKITHIIFDNRESRLYSNLDHSKYPIKIEPLCIGDITFVNENDSGERKDIIIFERKSLTDLLASIKDGRYEEQSLRLTHASGVPPHRIMYIIEGMFSSLRNPAEKQLVISAMTSLQLYKGFSVIRTSSVQETADLIEGMWKKIQRNTEKSIHMFQGNAIPHTDSQDIPPDGRELSKTIPLSTDGRELSKTIPLSTDGRELPDCQPLSPDGPLFYSAVVKKVKKDNITPENIGEIILCQIPGISSTIAVELMRKYINIRNLLEVIRERPEELKEMRINGRKMGSNVCDSILRFLG